MQIPSYAVLFVRDIVVSPEYRCRVKQTSAFLLNKNHEFHCLLVQIFLVLFEFLNANPTYKYCVASSIDNTKTCIRFLVRDSQLSLWWTSDTPAIVEEEFLLVAARVT